jgi:ribonucleoside-diphosphate reductase alpha chain
VAEAEAPRGRVAIGARSLNMRWAISNSCQPGRIIAGAGTGRAVTLFNCFVMGTIPDNLNGIFEHLREAALTMQQGGGVGMDFSTIRPAGAPVRGVGAKASGPLSFMDAWDAMCRTVMSAGTATRRHDGVSADRPS